MRGLRLAVLIIFVAALVAAWFVFDWGEYARDPELIRMAVRSHQIWSPLFFILIQTVAEVLLAPGLPFTIAGGLLFGTFWGSTYSIIASTVSSMIIFWLTRYVGTSSLLRYLHRRFSIMRKINIALADHGFKHVFILRVLPFTPGNLLSVSFGLTKVSSRNHFLGTFLGNLPSTIALSYFGNLFVTQKFSYIAALIVVIMLVSLYVWRQVGGMNYLTKEADEALDSHS